MTTGTPEDKLTTILIHVGENGPLGESLEKHTSIGRRKGFRSYGVIQIVNKKVFELKWTHGVGIRNIHLVGSI